MAELATLLAETRSRLASEEDTRVVVTLNGDFLWRSELDRRDKGCVRSTQQHRLYRSS